MSTKDTYDTTYQYSLGKWHTHCDLDVGATELLLRFLRDLNRNCRVRQNATGEVREVNPEQGKEPLTLLHLFFKRISDRNGKDTVV